MDTTPASDSNDMLHALTSAMTGAQPDQPAEAPPTPVSPEAPAASDDDILKRPAPTKEDAPLKKGIAALDDGDDEQETPEPEKEAGDDDAPADSSPKAKNAWSEIKKEIKTLKSEQSAWQAEKAKLAAEVESAKKLREADPVLKEVEILRAKAEEWEKKAAVWSLPDTKAYKQAVTEPLDALADAAQVIANENELDPEKLFNVLREPDRKKQNEMLAEIADSLPRADEITLYGIRDQAAAIYAKADEMKRNADAAYKEARERDKDESEKTALERKATEMRAVEAMQPALLKAAKYFKGDGETDESAAKAIITEANEVPFDEMKPDGKAFSVAAGIMVPRLLKTQKALLAKVKTLEKEIEGMAGSVPRARQGTAPSAGSEDAPEDMLAALRRRMADSGMPV